MKNIFENKQNGNVNLGDNEGLPTRDFFGASIDDVYQKYQLEDKSLIHLVQEEDANFYWHYGDIGQVYLFNDREKEIENNDDNESNYLPEEAGEPKWLDQSEDFYPEDREPVDKNGKDRDQIAEEFKKLYGLLNPDLVTFSKDKMEWQISGKDPQVWKDDEDDLDRQLSHERSH